MYIYIHIYIYIYILYIYIHIYIYIYIYISKIQLGFSSDKTINASYTFIGLIMSLVLTFVAKYQFDPSIFSFLILVSIFRNLMQLSPFR